MIPLILFLILVIILTKGAENNAQHMEGMVGALQAFELLELKKWDLLT